MREFLTNDNFEEYASGCYLHEIIDEHEFWEDLDRIKYIKRLFNRYTQTGDIKINLIVNHLIVMFNVFEPTHLQRMLFFKFEGYHSYLKPFLIFLQRLPKQVNQYSEKQPTLFMSDIIEDPSIVEELRKVLPTHAAIHS